MSTEDFSVPKGEEKIKPTDLQDFPELPPNYDHDCWWGCLDCENGEQTDYKVGELFMAVDNPINPETNQRQFASVNGGTIVVCGECGSYNVEQALMTNLEWYLDDDDERVGNDNWIETDQCFQLIRKGSLFHKIFFERHNQETWVYKKPLMKELAEKFPEDYALAINEGEKK